MISAEKLDWDKMGGLIPAIVQDGRSGRVLMLGFMNPDALARTLESGLVTFWSRTRKSLWTKGETSGNSLRLREVRADCDNDTLLVIADPVGPTCHRGRISCFGEDDDHVALEFLSGLEKIVLSRQEALPEGSYTTRLFREGPAEISKKLGEEAIELILASSQGRQRVTEEAADLLYHLLVYLTQQEVPLAEVLEELERRHQEAEPPGK